MKIRATLLLAGFALMACAMTAPAQIVAEDPAVQRKALPDLFVKSVQRIKPGSNQLAIVIANAGKGRSEASQWTFSCAWYPQPDGSPGAMFPSLPVSLPALKPGELYRARRACDAPAGKKIRFSVMLDVKGEVQETDEKNNTYFNTNVQ